MFHGMFVHGVFHGMFHGMFVHGVLPRPTPR
jgi:hypothetical protein